MKMKATIALLSSLTLLGVIAPVSEVKANDIQTSVQTIDTNEFEAVEVSKEYIISEYAELNNITAEEAANILFPKTADTGTAFRSVATEEEQEVSYVMFRAAAQHNMFTQNIPDNAGQVYFFCEVSYSGGFRGIHRIIYAGYNAGNLVFNGQFQYHLSDPNIINYTLNGGLYYNTTVTVSGAGSVGLGEVANAEVSVSSTSNFARNLYHHGNVRY